MRSSTDTESTSWRGLDDGIGLFVVFAEVHNDRLRIVVGARHQFAAAHITGVLNIWPMEDEVVMNVAAASRHSSHSFLAGANRGQRATRRLMAHEVRE